MRPRWLVAALWLSLAVGARAHAQEPAPSEAPAQTPRVAEVAPAAELASDDALRALLERGVAEYAAGRWDEARALFEQAHRLAPTARTARGIGMAAFNQRDYAAAVTFLALALSSTEQPLTDAQRAQVDDLRRKALSFVGRFRFDVTRPEARIEVGGAPTAPGDEVVLPLGRHAVRAEAPGFLPAERTLEVRGGEELHVTLTLVPAPLGTRATQRAAFKLSPWEWSLLGGAAAAGGAGLAVRVRGNVEFDSLERRCKARRCFAEDTDTSKIERLDHTATALWIAGGVLAATAGALITARLVRHRKSEREPVQVGFTGPGVVVRGRY
jgi:tetratricopeptide (TPR) repeat protein